MENDIPVSVLLELENFRVYQDDTGEKIIPPRANRNKKPLSHYSSIVNMYSVFTLAWITHYILIQSARH